MITIEEKKNCSGCHACKSACPKNCISMKADEEGFLYPVIDKEQCIDCGICEKICPIITPVENIKKESDIVAYAAYTKDENIRLNSSSGGLFTEIATHVITRGGVVFGAAFDSDLAVRHRFVENIEELSIFRGSKYLQSTIGNAYHESEEFLKSGRMVLFTGTPCQISGLYSYLKKPYDNLITQDIICHGVPSPAVWQKYIDHIEKNTDSNVKSVFFRDKTNGWKKYSVRVSFENEKESRTGMNKDYYMRSFLSDLCLRPSCYNCNFKDKIRISDFTLADFWGIQNIIPEMDDDKGTNLIFVNSQKGKQIFDSIKSNIVYKAVDMDEAIKYNPAMIKSAEMPKNRTNYMNSIYTERFDVVVKKYANKTTLTKRVFNRIKRIIKKIIKR